MVATWAPTYRDVIVVDSDNRVVTAYNLTANDLGVTENYDDLKDILLTAAGK